MIPLFDLHCDTLEEMFLGKYSFTSSPLHISLSKCNKYSPYIQIMAIWSDYRLSPKDAYKRYNDTISYAQRQGLSFLKDFKNLSEHSYILSVEGAEIIENDLQRLDRLKNDGVKVITLFWRDMNLLGGAWNTDIALSEFGIEFIKKCFELSIIPDISHASEQASHDIIKLAKSENKTIIASHSNSYSICRHKRNLNDDTFKDIIDLDGLVGISLSSQHLHLNGDAKICDILKHIYHYLSLGGINTICLGCDFDGVAALPDGIRDISDLSKLYRELEINFGSKIADKIFFHNAYNFFQINY